MIHFGVVIHLLDVGLYVWRVMHFYIDILIIVSEIFTKECQSANILGWLIHLEAEYNIILGGESKLLGVDI